MYVNHKTYATPIRRCTGKATWEDAAKDFPAFTQEERLRPFLGLKLKGGVPQPLRDFCQAAIDSKRVKDVPAYTVLNKGNKASFVEGSYKTISGRGITEKIPHFQGANLIVARLTDVSALWAIKCICCFNPFPFAFLFFAYPSSCTDHFCGFAFVGSVLASL